MDSKDLKKGWKKCEICNKTFVNISNFRAHIKLKHPDDAEKIDAGAKPTAKCNVCNKAIDKRYLTRHLKFKHPEVEEASSSKKMYDCTLCHKKFDTLHASLKQNHKCLKMLRCSLCEYENTSQEEVISHMKTLHSIAINSQNLTFDSIEKFEQWKTELEKDTVSKYNISHGSYGTKKYKRSQYYCQRSGYYIARGKQLRHLKSQGSKKINGFCPSKIDCRQEGEKCSVTFISTHVGHAADLGHLFLTSTERQELAIKVAQKIPFQFILDEIRESVYDDNLERIHLLKKKDLYNIERDFQLNNDSCRHTNDAISVETWVNQMRPTGCVLFYKPQGSPCSSSSELNSEDFVIVIMTQGQQELLNKFGEDCVCIDGTHGVNGYGFELHTLLVLDDLREGYPTAFLISSRVDEHVMTLFFSCVKDKLGKSIKPSVFMSDMADTYYNAWLNVMQPAKHRYVLFT